MLYTVDLFYSASSSLTLYVMVNTRSPPNISIALQNVA